MLFSRFLRASQAPAPELPTPDSRRYRDGHLRTAEWHLRAAVWEAAAGDAEQADFHLQGCREFIEAASGRRIRARTADELRHELQKELEL